MAITFVTDVEAQSGDGDSVTTGDMNSTGASLLVGGNSLSVGISATNSDSKSNTWSQLTVSDGSGIRAMLAYVANPSSVGSSHSGTLAQTGGFPALAFAAFAGVATASPFDQQNGGTSSASTTCATGNVTPSEDNELLVSVCASDTGVETDVTPSAGWTRVAFFLEIGTAWGLAFAYKIQTTATTEGCTWTANGVAVEMAARIASFKSAAGGGGGGNAVRLIGGGILGTSLIGGVLAG